MFSLTVDAYQIGIVCALPKEMTAVRAVLDEEHESLKSKDAQDYNSYILGRIHHHNVAVACLPAGTYGTNAAAAVSKDIFRTFTSLRICLLVGIGGAVPNPHEGRDIRLGDIVVSQPDRTHGGVIQYDLGKSLEKGTFERRGSLNKPPVALRTALSSLQSETGLKKSEVPIYLDEMYAKYPELINEGYCFPGVHEDRLHCSNCDPLEWWWILWLMVVWLLPFLRCDRCEDGWISRPHRTNDKPTVHYGIIASGNQLIKDAKLRDRLGRDLGALCVEMEAAGLDDYPCLVIRGICDYADAQKNDVWQKYAAVVAAAFAKALLHHVSAHSVQEGKSISELHIDAINGHFLRQDEHNQRQEAFNKKQEINYWNDQYHECHRVFKTSDYSAHKNINHNPVKNTCQWVLKHAKFQSWLKNVGNDLLWISADPGCGKSVLSKYLVDDLLRQPDPEADTTSTSPPIICYFFFKDNELQDSLSTALCALLHQLYTQQPKLIYNAVKSFKRSGEKIQREIDELWQVLQDSAQDAEAQSMVFVLDALDECKDSDRAKLINLLCQFYKASSQARCTNSIKWLITSRPYGDIQGSFEQIPSDLPSIRLRGEDESDQIREEIDLVIHHRMTDLAKEFHISSKKTSELTQYLLEMKNRTYLWLHLVIEDIRVVLRNSLRPEAETFHSLPESVEDAYEKILTRIVEPTQQTYVRTILTIIVGARQALTLPQMAAALDVATLADPPTALKELSIDPDHLERNIRQWCGLFVIVNHKRLYLLHQTAKEFLLSREGFLGPEVGWRHCLQSTRMDTEMARICVLFLCFNDFNDLQWASEELSWPVSNPPWPDSTGLSYYAAKHWAYHVRIAETTLDAATCRGVDLLYETDSPRYFSWTGIMWQLNNFTRPKFTMTKIHQAALNGHHIFLRRYLKSSLRDIDYPDAMGITPLLWAVEHGHSGTVEVLLDYGADVNLKGGLGHPLGLRTRTEITHLNAIQLPSEPQTNEQRDHYVSYWPASSTCLSLPPVSGKSKILWAGKTDLNLQHLQPYSVHDMMSSLRFIAKIPNVEGQTPLYIAAKNGNSEILRLLLEKGATVNAMVSVNINSKFTEALVSILPQLDKEHDAGQLNRSLNSFDFPASEPISVDLATNWQGKAADSLRTSRVGQETAICIATAKGHTEIVRMLIEKGADINVRSAFSSNPSISVASRRGYGDIVRLLLDAGADPIDQKIDRLSGLGQLCSHTTEWG